MSLVARQLQIQGASETSVQEKRRELGQFFTPTPVAEFMASLFETHTKDVRLLDAGAGTGNLSVSLIRRLCASPARPRTIAVTAFEIDESLIESLEVTMRECQHMCERAGIGFSARVCNDDFIEAAVAWMRADLFSTAAPRFNVAIANPPYRKIRNDSSVRLQLRSAGIETSNLYTGFLALISNLLTPGGELVAITPRSFCNGPYFKPFRTDFLATMSLRRLHVFESRSAAFNRDNILQENIIVHAAKGVPKSKSVIISRSSGEPGAALAENQIPYDAVVSPDDPEQFIHLVESTASKNPRGVMTQLPASLSDLGLSVSTGRVVDFRAKEFLRQQPESNTVPLIYPCHFDGGFVYWPKATARKPNAIVCNEQTRELLVPAGIYVLVKRFTAKEERKRIVACIYDPQQIRAPSVGFENHLNYFHVNGQGLTSALAKGLAAFLNSSAVDDYFRQFNGHTQVNATDLRNLNYPNKAGLEKFGHKITTPAMDQEQLDDLIMENFF